MKKTRCGKNTNERFLERSLNFYNEMNEDIHSLAEIFDPKSLIGKDGLIHQSLEQITTYGKETFPW